MFGEKKTENIKGVECPVWQTPKYEISRKKAIDLISKGDYGLVEGDFWVLMNTYASGKKVMYTGLILSHNGCLKINDTLEDPFQSKYLKREWIWNDNGIGLLIYEYNDGVLYEVGEVSPRNCKNDYPFAMAYKRCFDRVVLKKSKLAYSGIYSEVEAEEFKEKVDDDAELKEKITKKQFDELKILYTTDEIKAMFKELGITKGTEMTVEYYLKKNKEWSEKHKNDLPESKDGFY